MMKKEYANGYIDGQAVADELRQRFVEQGRALMAATKQRDELISVLEKFTDWNRRYPSSRIYSATAIRDISKELGQIAAEAGAAIASVKGGAA